MSSSKGKAYSYGDAPYWDGRYLSDGGASFDWYQRYSALRPFIRKYVPVSSRILMVGCGNAGWDNMSHEMLKFIPNVSYDVMSEDMVKDGYIEILNIDISSIVIEMMRKKYVHVPHLQYMQMDVRNMSVFDDESFDCVIDKGTLDSLMCSMEAPLSASQMIEEVNRILRPGGIYILITYGDPSVRIPHLNQPGCNWKITLYIIPRPGYQGPGGCSSPKSIMEPVPFTEKGQLPSDFVLEDPDSHYIYVCKKMHGVDFPPTAQVTAENAFVH